ncbi:MAG: hypothetical protein IH620_04425 [Ignavibacterium sp.]|nr:hypothetical protein [Ignavibacterium sp.]
MQSGRNKKNDYNTAAELQLDHIILFVNKKAPETELLREKGFFITDIINRQPEFGTSGRIIYFQNFYIELRWIEDKNVFKKSIIPLYKKRVLGEMKMGVALYNKMIINKDLPFKTKNYCWEWMNPGSCLKMVEIENELTPLYLILPHYLAFSTDKKRRELIKPLTNHENKINKLSNVKMIFKDRELNAAEKYFEQFGILIYQSGKGNYIELVFDNNKKGKEINLIKELSLKIKY